MASGERLLEDWTELLLYVSEDASAGERLRFPVQAPAYGSGELPRLLLVRSLETGRPALAGAGWWGKAGFDPEADAVRMTPAFERRLRRAGDPPAAGERHRAQARRARWYDVAVYAEGFWLDVWLALLVAAAALAGAAAAFATGTAPLGVALAVVVLLSLAEVGKAVKGVVDAARKT